MTRMAERLKLSKGWLSKMLKVAALPDAVIEAFGSPADVALKPAYPLAQALDDTTEAAAILKEARTIAQHQQVLRAGGEAPFPAAEVLRRLLAAPFGKSAKAPAKTYTSALNRPAVTVRAVGRQGVTLQLHAGSGLDAEGLVQLVADALKDLEAQGQGVLR